MFRRFGRGQEGEIWTCESLDAPIIDGGWTASTERGFLWTTQTESDQFLPQELAMDQFGGVDFDKGCYLGQEIIARVHFKGTKQAVRIGQLDRLAQGDEPPTVTDSEELIYSSRAVGGSLGRRGNDQTRRTSRAARIGDADLSFI